MTNHKVHETIPDGFHFADRLQVEAFMKDSSVPGAAKVCLVAGPGELPRLATRLRPPKDWVEDHREDYKDGWTDQRQGEKPFILPADHPYSMGYRDAAENRMKWHLAHCPNHGDHEGGCGA